MSTRTRIELRTHRKKKIIHLPHQMIKELVKTYVESFFGASRLYEEKIIGGRRLDLVAEGGTGKKPYKAFFEIETQIVRPNYISEFYRFCKSQNPNKAMLISPVTNEEERTWKDKRSSETRRLVIVPTRKILEQLNDFYSVYFEVLGDDIVLVFDPSKALIIETSKE